MASLIFASRKTRPAQRKLEDALENLTPFPEAKCQEGEKSIFHHILDQVHFPVPILQAYARAARLHEQPSKDDYYLFKDPHSKLCFSPTMYVWHCSPDTRSQPARLELFNILKGLTFRDRYYAESGPQPAGYTVEAFPQSVKYAMERERDAEQDRRRLGEHRRFLDQESEQRRRRADADEARELRAMGTRADAEFAIEQRTAHARFAGARENWHHEQNRAQYLAPLRVSEPEGRGRQVCRNEARNRRLTECQHSNRPLNRSSQPNMRRTSPRANSRARSGAMQTQSSSQGAGHSWPQYWPYMPTESYPSARPRSRNLPPTGHVIGPVDEN